MFAALIYPGLAAILPAMPGDVPGLVGLLVMEVVIGAWFGFMTRVLVMALSIAGGLLSYMIGLSSVLQMDPSLGAQVPALERMLGLAAIALLFASNLYIVPIHALIGSYEIIPPGSRFDAAGAADLATRAVSDSFRLALQLASPFIVTCLVWQASMAFISRMVPQIHIHVISAPAQIVGGLALLAATVMILLSSWSADMSGVFAGLPGF